MWNAIKGFFRCSTKESANDEFVWALANALLWRDEEVSMGALVGDVRYQPEAKRYYNDALYLIKYVTGRWNDLEEEQ